MRREEDPDAEHGEGYIYCVNLNCKSNGGTDMSGLVEGVPARPAVDTGFRLALEQIAKGWALEGLQMQRIAQSALHANVPDETVFALALQRVAGLELLVQGYRAALAPFAALASPGPVAPTDRTAVSEELLQAARAAMGGVVDGNG